MRIHTLQSVWSAAASALTRHLSEGGRLDQDLMGPLAPETEQRFCDDNWLNDKLVELHHLARLGYGKNIQSHIDTYIPAVAFLRAGRSSLLLAERGVFARRMVLCISDSPQEGTLPDLGFVLRSVMLGFRPPAARGVSKGGNTTGCDFPYAIVDDCYVAHMMLQALPCIRRTNRKDKRQVNGFQVGLNVLMGLLLGLYQSSIKFPPFPVRVSVYTEIHRLLTCGGGREFCEAHPILMTMAFMEYCAYVIPAYMPAEFDALQREQGMSAFFAGMPVSSDVFRQEMLNGLGPECALDWDKLEAHCVPVVDKHMRACKNKTRQRREDHSISSRPSPEAVCAFAALPYVTQYDVHLDDSTHRVLGSELVMLEQALQGNTGIFGSCDRSVSENKAQSKQQKKQWHETVAAMQRLLYVSPLPANVVRMQLRSLSACMAVCERSALDGMTLYICVTCGLCSGGASRSVQIRGQCRLDGAQFSETFNCAGASRPPMVCSHCQTPSVIAVNTLGRIVTLRNQRFFLAPCCCTVQSYSGSGLEFHSEYCVHQGREAVPSAGLDANALPSCPHQRRRPPQRQQRGRCEVCQTTSAGAVAPELFTSVDHLTGAMRSIRLCSRHAPRAEALRQVATWKQLMEEVTRRDRPLFSSDRK